VILFPEGTRTSPGQPLVLGTAAGAIAVRAGCRCLPVVITCTPPTLYKGLPWYRVPASRVDFRLRVCPPWQAAHSERAPAVQRRAARDFTRRLEIFFTEGLAAEASRHADRPSRAVVSPVL
jgi:1-acyl-sn-glycerol-3-phosphate acyltransferase